ncbi:signal peptidase I [Zafaria cholistanensis]|uniref:signal peptidase I n=1 Tax=Zafaria cholistanensis TaxID=1682741 RepID=UPI001CEDABE9|nr:signal peptidase I [Zafaria cholistanensis]
MRAAGWVLLVVLVLRLWVVEPLTVASDSMEPAVPQGSSVLMFKPGPALGGVGPRSLVVFAHPADGSLTLKRVVATAGQAVAIKDAVLVVDGAPVAEPGIDLSRIDATYFGPVTVPEGHVFVLGDNRGVSIDSRDFGSVPLSSIRATVPLPWIR